MISAVTVNYLFPIVEMCGMFTKVVKLLEFMTVRKWLII